MTDPAAQKKIILCADDYGLSAGVNRAIENLAQAGRISAVTCMGSGPCLADGAEILRKQHSQLAIGLHITLTYLPTLTGFPVLDEKQLLLRTWTRRIDRKALAQEIDAQFCRFRDVFGFAPDFIDGHQHIHVLPVVRDILFECRKRHAPHSWVRNVAAPYSGGYESKRLVVAVLGWRFRQLLRRQRIAHNPDIYGFYNYNKPKDIATLFRAWLGQMPRHGGLVYVHPAFPDAGLAHYDRVLQPRQNEYDFFAGEAFAGLCQQEKLVLVNHPSQVR